MIYEGVRIIDPESKVKVTSRDACDPRPKHDKGQTYILSVRNGVYDRTVAYSLALASTWAYSDIDTYAKVLWRRQIMPVGSETVGITLVNPVLFASTKAYVSQSADRKLIIVSFRGTEYQNMTNWLTDVTAAPEHFYAAGQVHGGFFRAALIVWESIKLLLKAAEEGDSICKAARKEGRRVKSCFGSDTVREIPASEVAFIGRQSAPTHENEPDEEDGDGADASVEPSVNKRSPLERVVLTGHSLGAAIAQVTAALMCVDPQAEPIRDKLHAAYLFGCPLVGDSQFVERFKPELEKKVFRHVQGNDAFTHLPPSTVAEMEHLGMELVSTDAGWAPARRASKQAPMALTSLGIGLLAFLQRQLRSVKWLSKIPMPYSLADHEPFLYLRTSRIEDPGIDLIL